MEELVRYIVGQLVDDGSTVTVESSEQNGITVINIIAGKDEIGKIIGKQGRIARAIRTLVKAAAGSKAKKISVEIIEK
ncbi:MAG TPA: KH domain-containing protein [Candidatus Ornithoclostridium excrementipullorum]|nr:KH domain-containing protein [Candidatus Ornithoclostridium excrementipullorum]